MSGTCAFAFNVAESTFHRGIVRVSGATKTNETVCARTRVTLELEADVRRLESSNTLFLSCVSVPVRGEHQHHHATSASFAPAGEIRKPFCVRTRSNCELKNDLRRFETLLTLLFDWEWSFGAITTSNVRRPTYHLYLRAGQTQNYPLISASSAASPRGLSHNA